MEDSKLIGCSLRKAEKSNERAYFKKLYCSCPGECSILKKGQCIHNNVLSICIYGKLKNIESSTKRSKAYYTFIKKYEEELKIQSKMPSGYYGKCIQLIGDYCYLPYPHMNLQQGQSLNKIPFLKYSSFLSSGSPFIKKEDLTVEVVIEAFKFKPYALMGGEIKDYQKETVPKFLFHLKYLFPDLYKKALKIEPSIADKVFKFEGKEDISATLDMIPINLIEGYYIRADSRHNLIVKKWDGNKIIVTGQEKDFGFLFNKFKSASEIEMTFIPIKEKTEVVIVDNDLKTKLCIEHPELIK